MEKPSISFFAMNLVLLFAVIGSIVVVFELNRLAFVFELAILLVLIFLLAFSMFAVYISKKLGWTMIAAILMLLLLDLFLIYLLTAKFETAHATAAVFSLIGIFLAFMNLIGNKGESGSSRIAEHDKATSYYPYIDKMEP